MAIKQTFELAAQYELGLMRWLGAEADMFDNPLLFGLAPLGGMQVYEEPLPSPKIQLREHIQVTDECRREVNAWLLARFGRKESALDPGKFLVSVKYGLVVAPHGMRCILSNIGA